MAVKAIHLSFKTKRLASGEPFGFKLPIFFTSGLIHLGEYYSCRSKSQRSI